MFPNWKPHLFILKACLLKPVQDSYLCQVLPSMTNSHDPFNNKLHVWFSKVPKYWFDSPNQILYYWDQHRQIQQKAAHSCHSSSSIPFNQIALQLQHCPVHIQLLFSSQKFLYENHSNHIWQTHLQISYQNYTIHKNCLSIYCHYCQASSKPLAYYLTAPIIFLSIVPINPVVISDVWN